MHGPYSYIYSTQHASKKETAIKLHRTGFSSVQSVPPNKATNLGTKVLSSFFFRQKFPAGAEFSLRRHDLATVVGQSIMPRCYEMIEQIKPLRLEEHFRERKVYEMRAAQLL